MKLNKIKKIWSIFFLIKDLNPFFYELVIDSTNNIKISKRNFFLLVKKKKLLKLRISNKTLVLFLIYLNIFSTKTINPQKNIKKKVSNFNIRGNLLYSNSIKKKRLMREHEILFFNIYLNRSNKYSALDIQNFLEIIKNLNHI